MKDIKLTIFQKIILFIILLLLPIVLLYSYSNTVSVSIIKSEINNSLQKRLSFVQNQLDLQMNHVMRGAFQLGSDPALRQFASIDTNESYFDVIAFKKQLEMRISVQSTTMDWTAQISIFFPKTGQIVSTESTLPNDPEYLKKNISNTWQVSKKDIDGIPRFDFFIYAVYPYSFFSQPDKADVVVEIKCPDNNILNILNDYKLTGQGDPFLYNRQYGVIMNQKANSLLVGQVHEELDRMQLAKSGSFQAKLDGSPYIVNYIKSQAFDWVLVDYVPMQQILLPITESNLLFYVSTLLLLLMSIGASFMLYRNVQKPIGKLVKGLQKVKQGDFSIRIQKPANNEFNFVFQRFNEMAEQIQQLIQKVYVEQLIARDAQLKQMQAQINPHFLYNCLYFIVNMTRLGKEDAVEKMAINLGEYFKYTTRLERQDATITEELDLIVNYLEIQNLRMGRIQFTIDLPEELRRLEIPRLLLQPVVENAVVHGIEPKMGTGYIHISGSITGNLAEISVEDSGIGVSDEKLQLLREQLKMPMDSSMGYGIWNVNQRLALRYGAGSGVQYSTSHYGGLCVKLVWEAPENELNMSMNTTQEETGGL